MNLITDFFIENLNVSAILCIFFHKKKHLLNEKTSPVHLNSTNQFNTTATSDIGVSISEGCKEVPLQIDGCMKGGGVTSRGTL